MKNIKLLLSTLLLITVYSQSHPHNIKAVCIDIETLLETHEMKASGYIGKINALKYKVKTGHLPCKADVFKYLAPIPALSQETTSNENMKMPQILCDWLLHAQSFNVLKSTINNYIKQSKLSDIEKTVLTNTVNMMLTPSELADTQQVISATQNLINSLQKHNYKIFIVGNWADSTSLQKQFPNLFAKCNGIFFSESIHHLKPYYEFYDSVLNKIEFTKDEVVWVEKEKEYIQQAKMYDMHVAEFNPKQPKEIITQLHKLHVTV